MALEALIRKRIILVLGNSAKCSNLGVTGPQGINGVYPPFGLKHTPCAPRLVHFAPCKGEIYMGKIEETTENIATDEGMSEGSTETPATGEGEEAEPTDDTTGEED